MKVIKFIRPKQDLHDVSKCDSCGGRFESGKLQFRSRDFGRFLCEPCKEVVDSALQSVGIDTKGYWKKFWPVAWTVSKPFKPYRPRGRTKKIKVSVNTPLPLS